MTSKIPKKQLGLQTFPIDTLSGTVLASSTTDIDTVPLASFQGIKYFISYWNDAQDKRKVLELSITKKTGSLKSSVYGKIGDELDVDVDESISGTDMLLTISNNELFPVTVNVARLIFT